MKKPNLFGKRTSLSMVISAGIFRYKLFNFPGNFAVGLRFCNSKQFIYAGPEPVAVHRDILPYTDFRMPRTLHIFAFNRKLLEELLTRPGACENHFNIFAPPKAAERNKLPGKVHDFHRLPPIDTQYITALSHGS